MVAGSLRDNGAVWLRFTHIPVEQEAEGMRMLALRSRSPFLLFIQARIPVHGMVPPHLVYIISLQLTFSGNVWQEHLKVDITNALGIS